VCLSIAHSPPPQPQTCRTLQTNLVDSDKIWVYLYEIMIFDPAFSKLKFDTPALKAKMVRAELDLIKAQYPKVPLKVIVTSLYRINYVDWSWAEPFTFSTSESKLQMPDQRVPFSACVPLQRLPCHCVDTTENHYFKGTCTEPTESQHCLISNWGQIC